MDAMDVTELLKQLEKAKALGLLPKGGVAYVHGQKRYQEYSFGAMCETEEDLRAYLPIHHQAMLLEQIAWNAYQTKVEEARAWHDLELLNLGNMFPKNT